jgi:outer membrane protein assembly factor BamB
MSYRSSALVIAVFCLVVCCRLAMAGTADSLIEKSGVQRGVCSVLGASHDLALDLAGNGLLVHVWDSAPERIESLREKADAAGLGIERVVAEVGRLDRLPYADHLVDLLVARGLTLEDLTALSSAEVLRILRPGGSAMFSSAVSGQPGKWAAEAGIEIVSTWKDASGSWIHLRRPPLEGADDWSHWEKAPDNNPVSTDSLIKAPYRTQFLAEPYYIGMPAVTTAAGGRTFLAVGHIAHHRREWNILQTLLARNGYNGTELWRRKLPEGYLVHRSAFIATPDTFHMIDGDSCLLLDARTGDEKGRIKVPDVVGDWKWMVIDKDVLYVLAGKPDPGGAETVRGDKELGGWSWGDLSSGYYGKRVPFGFGDTLAAYDLQKKKRLWLHKEETLIDSRGLALRDGRIYLYCPDRHFRSLRADTGELLWTNGDKELLELIEAPGKKLTSTPGFRSQTMTVATPEALIVQGQTRMNVVAVSAEYGHFLWTKKKITNNPNAIYVDGKVILGVGEKGSNVVIEPESGEVLEDLKFTKAACTRLTATPDSLFCRGEGTLRFDRESGKVLVDGAVRPACNDGAIAAGGILYLGPWQCDCNLSLIGCVAKCSAGDYQFGQQADADRRLELGSGNVTEVETLDTSPDDWPTYRGNNQRSASTNAVVASGPDVSRRWHYKPDREYVPTAPTYAGGLVFVGGNDGKVRALDTKKRELRWQYRTPAPIKYPPTIWEGRAYVGCCDGYVYALEAASGRLLWRFRAAPEERLIMVYGNLTSTWPVASGVLVHDGIAYFAAGIIDTDGTHVYALDAKTGKLRWQNNTSGHLDAELRKGVSVQGNLAIYGDRLVLAAGNQVSPAEFDLETGKYLTPSAELGRPRAPAGRFVGVLNDKTVIAGGRVLYSSPKNVANRGSFSTYSGKDDWRLNWGAVPPTWNQETVAWVNNRYSTLTCFDAPSVAKRIDEGYHEDDKNSWWRRTLSGALEIDGAVRWETSLGDNTRLEVLSLAVTSNAIVVVAKQQSRHRTKEQWIAGAVNVENKERIFVRELFTEPLLDGMLVDDRGEVVITMIDGGVLCVGPSEG